MRLVGVVALFKAVAWFTDYVDNYNKWLDCDSHDSLLGCARSPLFWLVSAVIALTGWIATGLIERGIALLSSSEPGVNPDDEPAIRAHYLDTLSAALGRRARDAIRQGGRFETRFESDVGAVAPHAGLPAPADFTSLRAAADANRRRVLVLGEPGAGKSTALLALADDLVTQALADLQAPLPLWIDLSTLTPTRRLPIVGKLFQRTLLERFATAVAQARHYHSRFDAAYVLRCIDRGRAVLLLDGLDEVSAGQRAELTRALNEQVLSRGELGVVVTCRAAEYASLRDEGLRLKLHNAVRLAALDRAAVDRHLADPARRELREAFTVDPGLYELLNTPLMLYLLLGAEHAGELAKQRAVLSRAAWTHKLLDDFVDSQLTRAKQDGTIIAGISSGELKQSLEWFGQALSRKGRTIAFMPRICELVSELRPTEVALRTAFGLLLCGLVTKSAALIAPEYGRSTLVGLVFAGFCAGLWGARSWLDSRAEGLFSRRVLEIIGWTAVFVFFGWFVLTLSGVGVLVGDLLGISRAALPGSLAVLSAVLLFARSSRFIWVGAALLFARSSRFTWVGPSVKFMALHAAIMLALVVIPAAFFFGISTWLMGHPAMVLAFGLDWIPLCIFTVVYRSVSVALMLSAGFGLAAYAMDWGGSVESGQLVTQHAASLWLVACIVVCSVRIWAVERLLRFGAQWLDDPVAFWWLRRRLRIATQPRMLLLAAERCYLVRRDDRQLSFSHIVLRDHFAVSSLIVPTASEDPAQRIVAAGKLGDIGEAAVDVLLELANEGEGVVRLAAVEALPKSLPRGLLSSIAAIAQPSQELLATWRTLYRSMPADERQEIGAQLFEHSSAGIKAALYDEYVDERLNNATTLMNAFSWDEANRRDRLAPLLSGSLNVSLMYGEPPLMAAALRAIYKCFLGAELQLERLDEYRIAIYREHEDPDVRGGAELVLAACVERRPGYKIPIDMSADLSASVTEMLALQLRYELDMVQIERQLDQRKSPLGPYPLRLAAGVPEGIDRALRALGDDEVRQRLAAVDVLSLALPHADESRIVRAAAAVEQLVARESSSSVLTALFKLGVAAPASIKAVLANAVLRHAQDAANDVRKHALELVWQIAPGPAAADLLFAALADPDLAYSAVIGLTHTDGSLDERVAKLALEHGAPTQVQAIRALSARSRIGGFSAPARQALERLVARATSWRGRREDVRLASCFTTLFRQRGAACVDALEGSADPWAESLMLRLLAHAAPSARRAAAEALGKSSPLSVAVVYALITALRDTDSEVAASALGVLEMRADLEHLPLLAKVANRVKRKHPSLAEPVDLAMARIRIQQYSGDHLSLRQLAVLHARGASRAESKPRGEGLDGDVF